MPAALALLIQYGLPQAISLIELWTKQQPDNPEPREWLDLLKKLKPYSAYVPADPEFDKLLTEPVQPGA